MKNFLIAVTAVSVLAAATPALAAAPCKDKQGKFMKCPAKPKVCRDAIGHFKMC